MILSWEKHLFEFVKPATTSRGTYTKKVHYVLTFELNGKTGIGEAAPLPDLSLDMQFDIDRKLYEAKTKLDGEKDINVWLFELQNLPAIQFAMECAYKDLNASSWGSLFKTDFTRGKEGIPINGLVWMDSIEEMYKQAVIKINEGYTCIKLKVGALSHQDELSLLEEIRKEYGPSQIEIRLDANGAYSAEEAMSRLEDFSKFEIHSIEQPIAPKQWEAMAEICANSPIDIALDEELIGLNPYREGEKMLQQVKPKYIVLKPTLIGGFKPCDHWIRLAERYGAEWWATSALEGNIALNHIAQWISSKDTYLEQGLGTGNLFKQNFQSKLKVVSGSLYYVF